MFFLFLSLAFAEAKVPVCSQEIQSALQNWDTARIEKALQGGDVINCSMGTERETPLHRAIRENQHEFFSFLLENGADFMQPDARGYRPLMVVAYYGYQKTLEQLKTLGANFNVTDRWGYTPLHWAAWAGHWKVVEYLLGAGVDVSIIGEKGNAVDVAYAQGNTSLAAFLEDQGLRQSIGIFGGISHFFWLFSSAVFFFFGFILLSSFSKNREVIFHSLLGLSASTVFLFVIFSSEVGNLAKENGYFLAAGFAFIFVILHEIFLRKTFSKKRVLLFSSLFAVFAAAFLFFYFPLWIFIGLAGGLLLYALGVIVAAMFRKRQSSL